MSCYRPVTIKSYSTWTEFNHRLRVSVKTMIQDYALFFRDRFGKTRSSFTWPWLLADPGKIENIWVYGDFMPWVNTNMQIYTNTKAAAISFSFNFQDRLLTERSSLEINNQQLKSLISNIKFWGHIKNEIISSITCNCSGSTPRRQL